jgi:hypothetical protein
MGGSAVGTACIYAFPHNARRLQPHSQFLAPSWLKSNTRLRSPFWIVTTPLS